MLEMPMIRIEVDRMKYQIIHAFSAHNDEIEKALEQELEKVIANYPFSEKIAELANDILTKAIQHSLEEFLLYGEGSQVLSSIVKDLLSGLSDKGA